MRVILQDFTYSASSLSSFEAPELITPHCDDHRFFYLQCGALLWCPSILFPYMSVIALFFSNQHTRSGRRFDLGSFRKAFYQMTNQLSISNPGGGLSLLPKHRLRYPSFFRFSYQQESMIKMVLLLFDKT